MIFILSINNNNIIQQVKNMYFRNILHDIDENETCKMRLCFFIIFIIKHQNIVCEL